MTRLVCQLWSILAIGKLFQRIYLSCRSKDLKVFQHISSHQLYRKAVRTLIFDASTSEILTGEENYFQLLVGQLKRVITSKPRNDWSNEPSMPRLQATKTIALAGFGGLSAEQVSAQVADITMGYEAYDALAKQELENLKSEEFCATIVRGLRGLPNLEEIILGTLNYQSPFCRSWPLTYLFPGAQDFYMKELEESDKIYSPTHTLLVRALSTSSRKVKTFSVARQGPYGIPLMSLHTDHMSDYRISTLWSMLNSYSGLKTLSLVINAPCGASTIESRWMRLWMPDLTNLSITTNSHLYEMVPFNAFTCWKCPRLRCLSLSGVRIEKQQLLKTLQVPLLHSLTIGDLELSGDCWISTLDSIRNCIPKHQHIFLSGALHVAEWDSDSYGPWAFLNSKVDDLEKKVERYINFGGINPLRLQSGAPAQIPEASTSS